MTDKKPEVVAWMKPAPPTMNSVDSVITANERQGASRMTLAGHNIALVRLSDYEKLQSEMATVKKVAYGNVELLGQVEALQAECEALRKDAERYRWLRDGCDQKVSEATRIATHCYGLEWDSRIDAAMAKEAHP